MIAIKKSCCADFGTATFVAFGIISVREKEKGLKSRLTGRMRAFQGQKKAFSYEKARFEKDPSHSKKGSIILHLDYVYAQNPNNTADELIFTEEISIPYGNPQKLTSSPIIGRFLPKNCVKRG